MEPSLPVPKDGLSSFASWQADLETWHDKYVLVDPSGLIFLETQKREYESSPISWVRHTRRAPITTENTANSGRPSEAFRRKSCPFPSGEPHAAMLVDVTKAQTSNSSQIVIEDEDFISEPVKSNKRRKIDSEPDGYVDPQPPHDNDLTVTLNKPKLTSLKKAAKSKHDWRRHGRTNTMASSNNSIPLAKINRKRSSDNFEIPCDLEPQVSDADKDALRIKMGLSAEEPLICSVCETPNLIKGHWAGHRFGKLACQQCGRFIENNFVYVNSTKVPSCQTGLKNCSTHYSISFDNQCRFCRLKKCLKVWPPDKLPLSKFANAAARQLWLSQRKPIIDAMDLSEPLGSPAKTPKKNQLATAFSKEPIISPKKNDIGAASRRSSRLSKPDESVDCIAGSELPSNEALEILDTSRRFSRGGQLSKSNQSAPVETSHRTTQRRRSPGKIAAGIDSNLSNVVGPLPVSNDFEFGDFVMERPKSVQPDFPLQSEKQKRFARLNPLKCDDSTLDVLAETTTSDSGSMKSDLQAGEYLIDTSIPTSNSAESSAFIFAAPKPRAAAIAASAAIRTQNPEATRRISHSPSKKESTREEPLPPKKSRRTVGGFQQPRISISSLKSVKPTARKSKVDRNDSSPSKRTENAASRKSALDSPEFIPPAVEGLKESIGKAKVEAPERKPRIKHVFRQGSSSFLPTTAAGASPPNVPISAPPSKASLPSAPVNKHNRRSPTPPPPLRAPIRVSLEKLAPKQPLVIQNSKSETISKKKSSKGNASAVLSPKKILKTANCNRCNGCRLPDCGKCKYCKDMPKFGGTGQFQHACERRVCESTETRLQDFSYRRIKLPTIQLPSLAPVPVAAVKEIPPASILATPPKAAEDATTKSIVLCTPPDNLTESRAVSSSSPGGSTEQPRRSSVCSNGLNCGSPIPPLDIQSLVLEEVLIPSVSMKHQVNDPISAPESDSGDAVISVESIEEELVDVSSLKPILTEFEPLPPVSITQVAKRRRICAAIVEDVSLERALTEGIAVVTTASLIPAIRALCLLCGSAGHESMIFCQLCAHPFHTFCLSMLDHCEAEFADMDLSNIDLSNWLCPSCQYCELCLLPGGSNNKLGRCSKCKHQFHPSCLAPNYRCPNKSNWNSWVCSRCVRCEECGATQPGGKGSQWSSDFKYCQPCFEARCRNYCPECNETYSPDDYSLRMLQCNRCDFWVHASPCGGLTEDLYDLFAELPDSVHFVCLKCAKKVSLSRPMIWEVRVQRLLADHLTDALNCLLNHIQNVVASLSPDTVETEDTVQCQLALAAMELDEQKDLINELCQHFVKGSYREVTSFIVDLWNVFKVNEVKLSWLVDFVLSAFTKQGEEFKNRIRAEVTSKVEGKREVVSQKEKERAEREKKSKKQSAEKKDKDKKKPSKTYVLNSNFLQNASMINHFSDDTRICRLCCRFGDGDPQEAGRLLYAGQDDWVHVNCALWSAEVFERGSLLCNVTQALTRSRHLKCAYCGRTGATLQCRETGCRLDFHFMCARENGHVFTEEHHCYCPMHAVEEDDETGLISDFSVDRRLICDPDSIKWRRAWLDGFNAQDVTVVIGSISILRLGTICELSDMKHVLVPLQYAIERIHWDFEDPTRLRVYRCGVDAVQSPNFEDPNHIATTIRFKTPGKIEEMPVTETSPPLLQEISVDEAPVPAIEKSPFAKPVKKNLDFCDEEALTDKTPKPFVTWSGTAAIAIDSPSKSSAIETNAGNSPPLAPVVQTSLPILPQVSPSKLPISPQKVDVNQLKRFIEKSPDRQTAATLLRTVHSSSDNLGPVVSPVASSCLSRAVPFAHSKPSSPATSPLKLPSSPPRLVKPNIPNMDPPVIYSKVKLESSEVTTGFVSFEPKPDDEVLSIVDHLVSRVAFADGDFSRHGASLLPEYASPKDTTLELLRAAAGLNGSCVPSIEANQFYMNTMASKYHIKVKSLIPQIGPKPVIANPVTSSVPLILNHSKMNAAKRTPEMDLFPVSIFPVPLHGNVAKRHQEAMRFAEQSIASEQQQQQQPQLMLTSSLQPCTSTARVIQQQQQLTRPVTFQIIGRPIHPAASNGVTKPSFPVARLSLVTQPRFNCAANNNNGLGSTRIMTLKPVLTKPNLAPVKPIIVPAQQTRPRVMNSVVPPVMGSPPQHRINVAQLAASSRWSYGNAPALRLPGPRGIMIGQQQQTFPDIPVSTIATYSTRLPAPFMNVSLPPISPVADGSTTSHNMLETSCVGPSLPKFHPSIASPNKVRFQDTSKTTLLSPQNVKIASARKQDRSDLKKSPQLNSAQLNLTNALDLIESSFNRNPSKLKKKRRDASLKSSETALKKSKSVKDQKDVADANKQLAPISKRPRTPLSLASFLPKSPLKACLPATELALAEIVNRVVTESVLFDAPEARATAHRLKQQRYLVFDIHPSTPNAEHSGTWKVRGFTWQDAWRVLFAQLGLARQRKGFSQLSYDSLSGLTLLGLTHNSVIALVEQLPGADEEAAAYAFKFARYEKITPNPAGCARALPYVSRNWQPGQRRHRDVFCFLMSNFRRPKVRGPADGEQEPTVAASSNGMVSWEVSRPHKAVRRPTTMFDLPLPTRLRYLKETAKFDVGVFRSAIHARGLYALRDFEAQEMIIEYAGELIRGTLTDYRERMYESKGIGCYMFRLDDTTVIDATMCGNAGRFINHCCEPNCYSRVIVGHEGLKHIVIFALRPIAAGEELTYDYKFPLEDATSKIPCYCGARRCRKYLN